MAFDKNFLIQDRRLQRYDDVDVEAFLVEHESGLADLALEGKPIHQVISAACSESGVDPRVILTKLQVEQGLISKQHPSQTALDWALGYGCPDSGTRLEQYRGLGKQIKAAAATLRGYLNPSNSMYVGGYVGKDWKVSDGTVTCVNIATAALYRYTPWIGAAKVLRWEIPFGNYLFYLVWKGYFGEEVWDGAAQPVILPTEILSYQNRSRGDAVFTCQSLLQSHGADIVLDGDFGPVTDAWVRLFQKQVGLTVDGWVGKNTWAALGTPGKELEGVSITTTTPTPQPAPTTVEYPSGLSVPIVTSVPSGYEPSRSATAAPLIKVTLDLRNAQVSPHFKLGEFVKPQHEYARVDPKLVALAERIRKACGNKPISVSSGYRPPAYNAAVGGAKTSFHLDGAAFDFQVDGMTAGKVQNTIRNVQGLGGLGLGSTFTHADIRPYRTDWTY